MAECVKTFITSVVGGGVAAAAIIGIFKFFLEKVIDKAVDASFEKSTIKFTNTLERTTKAYELLLKKEFDFYEKLDPNIAMLVPLIQDLEFWTLRAQKDENAKENFREDLMKYLKAIPEIKNDSLMHQVYIPNDVFRAVSGMIKNMQDNIGFLAETVEKLYGKSEEEIDAERIHEIVESNLVNIALVETKVKFRLDELAGRNGTT